MFVLRTVVNFEKDRESSEQEFEQCIKGTGVNNLEDSLQVFLVDTETQTEHKCVLFLLTLRTLRMRETLSLGLGGVRTHNYPFVSYNRKTGIRDYNSVKRNGA